MRRTRHELGNFHQYFDLSLPKLTCNGSCSKPTTLKPNKPPHKKKITHKYIKYLYTKTEPYYKKTTKTPQNLFSQNENPSPNYTPKTLPIINVAKRVIPLDFVKSIHNYMNYN